MAGLEMTSLSQSPRDRILWILANNDGKMERSRLRTSTGMRYASLNPCPWGAGPRRRDQTARSRALLWAHPQHNHSTLVIDSYERISDNWTVLERLNSPSHLYPKPFKFLTHKLNWERIYSVPSSGSICLTISYVSLRHRVHECQPKQHRKA